MATKKDTTVKKAVKNEKTKLSPREIRRELKSKNVEVEIINLTSSKLVYTCPKTHTEIIFEECGDSETVDLDLLVTMKNKHKKFFSRHYITIVDVYSEDYTIEDILTYLGVDKFYSELENTDVDYIEDIILNSSVDDFEKIVRKSSYELANRIAERAVKMYKDGDFDSRYKCEVLAEKLEMDHLFDLETARKK